MNIIKRFFSLFQKEAGSSNKNYTHDLKLSELITKINAALLNENDSLQLAGHKYIEHFFKTKPSTFDIAKIKQQLIKTSDQLENGFNGEALQSIEEVHRLLEQKQSVEYVAKTTEFQMPVFKNGEWYQEKKNIPLCSILPISLPKIKEVKLELSVENVYQQEDEVFIRLQANKKAKGRNIITLELAPEQDEQKLNQVVKKYQETLTTQS